MSLYQGLAPIFFLINTDIAAVIGYCKGSKQCSIGRLFSEIDLAGISSVMSVNTLN